MKFVTENLNLSLLEITAVLLPGSAFLLLMNQIHVVQEFFSSLLPDPKSEWQVGFAFLGAAYFCGYLLFSLGSLLDDPIYENCKHFFFKKEVKYDNAGIPLKDKSGKEIKERPKIVRDTTLFKKALNVKKKHLKGTDEFGNEVNLYKWTSGYLLAEYQMLYSIVERHQAASKFFRSMVWVFVVAISVSLCNNQVGSTLIAFLLLCMSIFIYVEQREKAIRAAYEYLLVVDSTQKD